MLSKDVEQNKREILSETFSHEPMKNDGSRFWLLACERVTAKNSLGKEQYRDRNSEKQHKTLNCDFRFFAY